MSPSFVSLACLFFLACLHQVHPMVVNFNTPPKDEAMNFTKTNMVKGDQILSKKRGITGAMEELDTFRDPRMTIIKQQTIRGGQIFPGKRELVDEEEKTQKPRDTFIETNGVAGNQFLSKKENVESLAGPETVRDPRFTIIDRNDVAGNQIIRFKRETNETLAGEEKTQNPRDTFIETNRVAGNQFLSKKRESIESLAGLETVRDPRMTIIKEQTIQGGQFFPDKREVVDEKEQIQDRRDTFIETNGVAGNQILSKRGEDNVTATEPEVSRDRRLTVIGTKVITKNGRVFREKRETVGEEEKTQDRRDTFIETNRVAGNQILSKKRESVVAPVEPEMRRDRRLTVIKTTSFNGVPSGDMQSVFSSQPSANRMSNAAFSFPASLDTGFQSASLSLAAPPASNGQGTFLAASPSFVKELTVNGNQFLSK